MRQAAEDYTRNPHPIEMMDLLQYGSLNAAGGRQALVSGGG